MVNQLLHNPIEAILSLIRQFYYGSVTSRNDFLFSFTVAGLEKFGGRMSLIFKKAKGPFFTQT